MSSSSDSLSSIVETNAKNRWLTPEREEIFKKLPRTVLGYEQPGPGGVKQLWENSKLIRKRHSLQTTRIEVSKYYNKKKKVPTPVRTKLHKLIEDQTGKHTLLLFFTKHSFFKSTKDNIYMGF